MASMERPGTPVMRHRSWIGSGHREPQAWAGWTADTPLVVTAAIRLGRGYGSWNVVIFNAATAALARRRVASPRSVRTAGSGRGAAGEEVVGAEEGRRRNATLVGRNPCR